MALPTLLLSTSWASRRRRRRILQVGFFSLSASKKAWKGFRLVSLNFTTLRSSMNIARAIYLALYLLRILSVPLCTLNVDVSPLHCIAAAFTHLYSSHIQMGSHISFSGECAKTYSCTWKGNKTKRSCQISLPFTHRDGIGACGYRHWNRDLLVSIKFACRFYQAKAFLCCK